MDCLVCTATLRPHLRKDFAGLHDLGVVHYEGCPDCGLVVSRTHFEMDDDAWGSLNEAYHAAYQGTDSNADDPNWLTRQAEQARVLAALHDAGLATDGRWLDYAAGDGSLADDLTARGVPTAKYERYLPSAAPGYVGEDALVPGAFDLVLTTCVFEHLRGREPFDEVARLVAPAGAMALHTLVRGAIPTDPAWFYLLAVHCTFWTNDALALLLGQWGYRASLYHVPARLWVAARTEADDLATRVQDAGIAADTHVKDGFVAYWT